MAVFVVFIVASILVAAFFLGFVSWLIALPAIGVVVAILIGLLTHGRRGPP